MAISKTFYSLSLSAIFTLGAMTALDRAILSNDVQRPQETFNTFRNVLANINSFHDVKEPETVLSINNAEVVINVINSELDKEIKHQKGVVAYSKNKVIIETDTVKINYSAVKRIQIKNKPIIKEEKKSVVNDQMDLSIYEINNSELISLKNFNVEKIVWNKITIPENIFEIAEDKINVANAAVEKSGSIEPVENNEVNTQSDDLVMYEYSDKENTVDATVEKKFDKKLYDRPLSKTVMNVIKREIGGEVHKLDTAKISKNVEIQKASIADEYSNNELSADEALKFLDKKEENKDEVSFEYSAKKETKAPEAFASSVLTTEKYPVEVTIKVAAVNMNTQKINQLNGFEFIPDYDRNERVYDQNTGTLKVGMLSTQNVSIQTGVFEARGYAPTRTELVMNTHNQLIPMIEESSYLSMLEKRGADTQSSILLSLPESVEDVDIDSEYSAKLNLDKNLKETVKNRQFIMFTGVKSGNVLIRYKKGSETAEKIVYVGEAEIFFEEPTFVEGERISFDLTTRSLLSSKKKELNLEPTDVKLFNSNTYSKKSGLSTYELKTPTQIFGNRKYIQVKNQGNDIFVGMNNENKIEIPSKDFVQKILDFNEVRTLDDRCLIQINNKKEIQDIKIAGKNSSGDMYTEVSYLDFEGNLSKDNPELAEKVFVIGENEGIINLFINYADGSQETVKSYCSNGTFLIEAL